MIVTFSNLGNDTSPAAFAGHIKSGLAAFVAAVVLFVIGLVLMKQASEGSRCDQTAKMDDSGQWIAFVNIE
jgi:hypothetical protein